MEMISEILARYKTDKVNPHTYGATYDRLFSDFDRLAPLNILEIGIQKGGSLCAWQDYFPNASVTGLDIVDEVLPEYRRDTIRYIFSDINDWKTDETFDIIIDDGSHFIKDVFRSVSILARQLNVGGVFVIEDVQHPENLVPAVIDMLSPIWAYNKGFSYSVGFTDESRVGLEDNFMMLIKRKA